VHPCVPVLVACFGLEVIRTRAVNREEIA